MPTYQSNFSKQSQQQLQSDDSQSQSLPYIFQQGVRRVVGILEYVGDAIISIPQSITRLLKYYFGKNKQVGNNLGAENIVSDEMEMNQLNTRVDNSKNNKKKKQSSSKKIQTHTSANISMQLMLPEITKMIPVIKWMFVSMIAIMIGQFIILTLILLRAPISSEVGRQILTEQQESTLSGFTDADQPGARVLQDFTVNKGVIDVGFNVDVNKRSISTRQHGNCKTPVPPPDKNGCGFSIVPSSLGIPIRGVHFKNIKFSVESSGEARLKLDVKNFERGDLVQDLGTWNQSDPNQSVLLPERIQSSDAIHIRLWTDGGDITINQIRFEYVTVDMLKPTTLMFDEKIRDTYTPDSTGYIYEDRRGNRVFNSEEDRVWSCKADFPGVQPFKIGETGSVILLRDEDCYTEVKPDLWYTDDKFGVLPEGNWLVVFPENGVVFPFEIKVEDKKPVITLSEYTVF